MTREEFFIGHKELLESPWPEGCYLAATITLSGRDSPSDFIYFKRKADDAKVSV